MRNFCTFLSYDSYFCTLAFASFTNIDRRAYIRHCQVEELHSGNIHVSVLKAIRADLYVQIMKIYFGKFLRCPEAYPNSWLILLIYK